MEDILAENFNPEKQARKNISFEHEIIGKSLKNQQILPRAVEDMSEIDSDTQSRTGSVDESTKKFIYKQAENINKVTQIAPKLQRINDSVYKVYGLTDPPPGFGLCYPKYYYLEQKKPQPMSPLKVWRGFNGNIYFEPIVCNNLNRINKKTYFSDSSENYQTIKKETSTLRDILLNDQESDYYLKLNQNQSDLSPNFFPFLSNSIESRLNIPSQQQNNDLEEMSSSSIDANNKNYTKATKMPPNNSPNIFTTKDIVFHDLNKIKLKRSQTFVNSPSRPILPNLSAVKRNNSPLRGLAYKELKTRLFSNDNLSQQSQENDTSINSKFNSSIELKNSQHEHFNSNRPSYKELLKGIRKGVTLNNFSKAKTSLDLKENVKFVDLTQTKQFSLIDQPSKSKNSKSVRDVKSKKLTNILNIKGDRLLNIELIPDIKLFKASKDIEPNNNHHDDNNEQHRQNNLILNSSKSNLSFYNLTFKRTYPTPES